MKLRNKKVLVTGADGFIGSHLVERLLKEQAKVRSFVYYNSFNSWGWLDSLDEKVKKNMDVFAGDVRDPNGVRKAVEGVDIVFHLAALIGIPFSYHSPDSYVDTNIKGTLNVLQAARDEKVGRVLITSTSEVYGTAQYVPIDERHPRQGQSPYSASKIAADAMAESFYRSFGLPVVIVRPFNTYGPRQSARAVIPTIITQILSGKSTIELGALHPTRDLVYVQDAADAFLAIAQSSDVVGQDINIATGREISIGDLAAKIKGLMKAKIRIQTKDQRLRPQHSEVERLLGDNSKMKQMTGWQPSIDLDEGLRRTIAWFKDSNAMSRYKPDIYNV